MGLSELNKIQVDTVLGLDMSTNSFAFCVYGSDGPIRWGEIEYRGANVYERLSHAQSHISALRDDFKTDLIVFEGAIYVQNKRTVILMAYAIGAAVAALMSEGTRVEEISPQEWQNAIGNGVLKKAEKEVIQEANPGKSKTWYSAKFRDFRKKRTMDWVKRIYGISVDSDNVSDAIAIASVAHKKYSNEK